MPPLHGDLTTLREVAVSDVYTLFTLFSVGILQIRLARVAKRRA